MRAPLTRTSSGVVAQAFTKGGRVRRWAGKSMRGMAPRASPSAPQSVSNPRHSEMERGPESTQDNSESQRRVARMRIRMRTQQLLDNLRGMSLPLHKTQQALIDPLPLVDATMNNAKTILKESREQVIFNLLCAVPTHIAPCLNMHPVRPSHTKPISILNCIHGENPAEACGGVVHHS